MTQDVVYLGECSMGLIFLYLKNRQLNSIVSKELFSF